jgi:hypothetical protein
MPGELVFRRRHQALILDGVTGIHRSAYLSTCSPGFLLPGSCCLGYSFTYEAPYRCRASFNRYFQCTIQLGLALPII